MTEPLALGTSTSKPARWLRCLAACALACTIGIAPAVADGFPNAHEGGQGQDKERALAVKDRSSGEGIARAVAVAQPATVPAAPSPAPEAPSAEIPSAAPEGPPAVATPAPEESPAVATPAQPAESAAPAQPAESPAPAEPAESPAVADVASEEDANAWTRTTSRTVVTPRGIIRSVTRSFSYAADEDGNLARAKAVAIARAPNDAAAVENGAGRITAKTSVDVTGNGAASADAGGSIAVNDGKVEVGTWGRTSAEVF